MRHDRDVPGHPPARRWRPDCGAAGSRPWRRRWCRRYIAGRRCRRARPSTRVNGSLPPRLSASLNLVAARQRIGRHHLLDVPHHGIDQRAFQQCRACRPCWRPPRASRRSAGSASCSTEAKFSSTTMASAPQSLSWNSSSRGLYSGLTFTAGHAGAQDAGDRHRILQHVRHHDGDAGAALQALALQPGGEGARGLRRARHRSGSCPCRRRRPWRRAPGSFPRTSPPATGSATCRSRRARPADNAAAKVAALAVAWRFPHMPPALFRQVSGWPAVRHQH